MKILITGVKGQVGHALIHELTDHELIGLTRQDCDLTNLDKIKQEKGLYRPTRVLNILHTIRAHCNFTIKS